VVAQGLILWDFPIALRVRSLSHLIKRRFGGADPLVGVPSGPGRPRPAFRSKDNRLRHGGRPTKASAADRGSAPPKQAKLQRDYGESARELMEDTELCC
jgi:hypothetical protein